MQLDSVDFRQMGELVYGAIRDAILTDQLAAGSRLSQDALARQLGVSRAPVRDALNRLEAEGLVRTAPPKGVVVAEMTMQELLDIFELRALIDSYVARRACEFLGDAEISRLQEIVDVTAQLSEGRDIHKLVQAHADFHHLIYSACGNAELNRIARSLWDRSYRYRVTGLLNRAVALSSLDDHRAILQALREGDALRAEELMAKHNQQTIDRILSQVGMPAKATELSSRSSSAAVAGPFLGAVASRAGVLAGIDPGGARRAGD
ncbi:MAG: GntR family transcriptional regulator [Chloroflexota bacterium]